MSNIKKGSKLTVSTANGISRTTSNNLGVLEISGPKMTDIANTYGTSPAHLVIGATDVSGILQVGINQLGDTFIDANTNNVHKDIIMQKYGGNLVVGGGTGAVKVGVQTLNPSSTFHINSTDGLIIPVGTAGERPDPAYQGMVRYNTTTSQFEGYGPGGNWGSLGGVINVAQNTKITVAEPDADSSNNEIKFYTAPTGDISANSATLRMIIDSSGNVGVGTAAPRCTLDISATDALLIPIGTSDERPTDLSDGMIRYNTTTSQFEGYGPGGNWGSLGGVINVAQNTKITVAEPNADSSNNEIKFYTAPTGDISSNSATLRMILDDEGNVGIGKSTPQTTLDIGGTTSTIDANIGVGDFNFYTFSEEKKILPSDPGNSDEFGNSVAISGKYAIVGAQRNDINNSNVDSGSAYIFDVTTGTQLHKLVADDESANTSFGWSVAISGNYAIVGRKYDDPTGSLSQSGSAYIFDVTTGTQLHKLTAGSDAGQGHQFGYSVGIDGNYAIVGEIEGNDDNIVQGSSTGAAYIFNVTTGARVHKLNASDSTGSDEFGTSVAISGNYAIVGAPMNDNQGNNSGSAYIFNVTTGAEVHFINESLLSADDHSGFSVAISGNYAIVGARYDDDAGNASGSACVYNVTTGSRVVKLTASDAGSNDYFGYSVAISGIYAIVGGYLDDDGGSQTGSAWIFDVTTGTQIKKITASDAVAYNYLGKSVAISGTYAIVGSVGDDGGASSDGGSAYIFGPPVSRIIGGQKVDGNLFIENGNVGIGTTNPLKKLHIDEGDILITSNHTIPSNDSLRGLIITNRYNDTSGMSINNRSFFIGAETYSTPRVMCLGYYGDSTGMSVSKSILTLKDNGNVGIGTTSPSYKLDVNGTFICRSGVYIPDWIHHINDTNTQFGFSGNHTFTVKTYNGDRLIVNNTGVGIGRTPSYNLDVNGTAYFRSTTYFGSSTHLNSATYLGGNYIYEDTTQTSKFGFPGVNQFGVLTNSNWRFWIESDGRVGIGTTTIDRGVCILDNQNPNQTIGNYNIGHSDAYQPHAALKIFQHLSNPTSRAGNTSYGRNNYDPAISLIANYTGSGMNSLTHIGPRIHFCAQTRDNPTSGSGHLQVYASISGGRVGTHSNYKGEIIFCTTSTNRGSPNEVNLKPRMILAEDLVGIGTTSPQAGLHVLTTSTQNSSVYGSPGFLSTDGGTGRHNYGNQSIAIRAEEYIWIDGNGGGRFIISSDERIKKNIVDVPDNLALEMVRNIPVRYYEYRNKKNGEDKTIGFIAQEVKEVLPMAVGLQTNIIPNEMRNLMDLSWNGATLYTDLSDCSGIKYRFYVSNDLGGNDEVMKEVVGNSDNSFTFDTSYNNVFCYGKEVDDFHTLDKNKLFALNFSATQELDRKVIALETVGNQDHNVKILDLYKENEALKARLAKLEAFLGI